MRIRRLKVYLLVALLFIGSWGFFRFSMQYVEQLVALDTRNGHVTWVATERFLGNPVLAGDRLLMQSYQPNWLGKPKQWQLRSLDAASGQTQWITELSLDQYRLGGFGSSEVYPLYTDSNSAYASLKKRLSREQWDEYSNGKQTNLWSIDLTTGKHRWIIDREFIMGLVTERSESTSAAPTSSPSNRLITLSPNLESGQGGYHLRSLDPQTGKVIWQTKVASAINAPVASDRTIFFTAERFDPRSTATYAYNIATGEEQFTIPGGKLDQQLYFAHSRLYRIDRTELAAFDATTGQEQWKLNNTTNPSWICASNQFNQFHADDQSVYVVCPNFQGSWLIALNPNTGSLQWRKRFSPAPILYTRSRNPIEEQVQILASTPETVFVVKGVTSQFEDPQIVAVSTLDGTNRWHTSLSGTFDEYGLLTDGDRLFVVDATRRWKNWLTRLKTIVW